ncbi:MAG: serine/threonine protein kinase [Myxococcales bacterium]|nr:serine/threonine protein kinase [Myxococcales bacterium]
MSAEGQRAQRFGKYTLLSRLAVGGMAEIFLARQEGMQGFSKKIVIKRIRPHLSDNEEFVKMFLNEARLVAQLNHSNIVQIYDLGRIGKCYFLSMEYVHGRDMRSVLARSESRKIPFPLEYSLRIAASACEGLYYAHRLSDDEGHPLNIVHRDVTPENIMVSFDGEVKILDFGIARAENLLSETRTGEIKGKLSYMSPEQITGRSLDHRSDIFSLGVVLYEWVTGHKLFSGGADADIIRAVVEGRIYPPSYFCEGLPAPVEAILNRALSRNREERYQSAWDMQYDIEQFLSHHEFNPSAIHLSNFIRQLFAEELAKESRAGSASTDLPPAPTAEEEPADPAPESPAAPLEEPEPDPLLRRKGTGSRKVQQAVRQGTDRLQAEVEVQQECHLSVEVEMDRELYLRLHEIARRNRVNVADLIRDLLRQFAKYLG